MYKVAMVTGATGFIGQALTKELLRRNYLVYALSRRMLNLTENNIGCLKTINLEMKHYDQISIELDKIDVLFLVAWDGIRGSDRLNENLQENNCKYNVELVRKLIETNGVKIDKIVILGSKAEFERDYFEKNELNSCIKICPYGRWKTTLYKTLSDRFLDVKVVNARIYSVFGPGDSMNSLISKIIDSTKSDNEFTIENPDQPWSYTYLPDIISGLIFLAENEKATGVYNLGSSEVKTLKNYCDEIFEIIYKNESSLDIEILSQNYRIFDTEKINKLGWSQKYTFKQGIYEMLESEK